MHELRGYAIFVLAYGMIGYAIAARAGQARHFDPWLYFTTQTACVALAAGALAVCIRALFVGKGSPLKCLVGSVRSLLTPAGFSGIAVSMLLLVHMGIFTSLKTLLPLESPFAWDPPLAQLDAALHGGDAWHLTAYLVPAHAVDFLDALYTGGWSLVLMATLGACAFVRGRPALRARALWVHFIAWPLLGNLVAAMFVSAGPIFYDRLHGGTRFAGLLSHLVDAEGATQISAYLWRAYQAGGTAISSGISAFPSVHVAQATLVLLLARRVHRLLFAVAFVFWGLILVGSVHLGWHYAVDGYFSIAAIVLLWKGVGWVISRSHGTRDAVPSNETIVPGGGLARP